MDIDKESLDAITEIINIGVGRSASLLNQMTNSNIRLRVPKIFVIRFKDLADTNASLFGGEVLSTVMLEFQGNFSGVTAILFPPESAAALVTLLSGENDPGAEMDAIRVETLKEVGNIIINSVMGSISNVLSQHLSFTLPVYYEGKLSSITATRHTIEDDDCVIVAHTQFLIESRNIEGKILLLLEVGSLEHLVESIQGAYI
ncbi:MAG: chemotaxis protein CheX [Methanoregula sp.]|jgi:chemotaxis protein CheC|uniref:chemotaxis protein CheX n=1 Tax=Methanoregula sp. TaxID=2052170 RepID=UPI003D100BCD